MAVSEKRKNAIIDHCQACVDYQLEHKDSLNNYREALFPDAQEGDRVEMLYGYWYMGETESYPIGDIEIQIDREIFGRLTKADTDYLSRVSDFNFNWRKDSIYAYYATDARIAWFKGEEESEDEID